MADELEDNLGLPPLPDDFLSGIKPTLGKVETSTEDKDKDKTLDELEKDLDKDNEKDKNSQDLDKDKDQNQDKDKDKDKSTDDNSSIVDYYKQELGVDLDEEFEDSLEGSTSYLKKVIEKKQEEARLEGQEELLARPELKALKEHLDAGYGLESFLHQREMYDFKSIDLDKDGEETDKLAENLYRAARQAKGDDPEEIEEAVATAKDNGKIRERGKAGLAYLDKKQEEEFRLIKEKEKAANDKAIADQKELLNQAETVFKSGKILGVSLDKDKANKLREFAFKEDKQVLTARDKAYQNLTIEQHLFLDNIVMNGFKDFAKPDKEIKSTDNIYKKIKEEQDKKKRIDLQGSGGTTKNRPDPATMFLNN